MKLTNKKCAPNQQHAFTLMELIVVLSIITLLAGLAIPAMSGLVTSQRYDECREQLKRIGSAIVSRAEFLAKSPDFALELQNNIQAANNDGPIIAGANYMRTVVHYFPFHNNATPTPSASDLELLTTATSPIRNNASLNTGGPYLGTLNSPFGATSGSNTNQIRTDPWGNDIRWNAVLNNNNPTLLWQAASLFSGGPNNLDLPGDQSLRLNIHLYPVLAEETHRRIEVVNKAILEYNKVNLPGKPLPTQFWDRSFGAAAASWANWDAKPYTWTDPANGTADLTAYDVLTREGYLPRMKASDGTTDVDFYALDAWGYVLLTDKHASTKRLICDPARTTAPFYLTPAITGPVMRVVSGNLIAGSGYSGQNGGGGFSGTYAGACDP